VTDRPAEAIRITAVVAKVLDQLGVSHAVVGSLASSLHGIPRSTNDVDIVAALGAQHAEPLAAALEAEFYVDADMIRDAVAHASEFNVIHLGTMFKVDIFVPDRTSRAQLDRAAMVAVDAEGTVVLRVASPEDTIAHKLSWFRSGGETSDRQWQDVLGVVAVQGATLDVEYLRKAADALAVRDLLEKAILEAETR
jgi:hypothetical protein